MEKVGLNTRVLLVLGNNQDEYAAMLQNLKTVAEKLATRINLRVGVLMTGQAIVQSR